MPFKLINAAVVPLQLNFNPHLMQLDVKFCSHVLYVGRL